jgi:hypothetical protein
MVAGRRFRGDDQQQATEHQPRGGGQLRVETLLEDGRRTREERRLRAGVEAGGAVDEEHDGDGQQAEHEHPTPEPPPARAGGGDAEPAGEQRHRYEEVRVGVHGGLDTHGRRPRRFRQPRVAGAADLDAPVVDELRGEQAGGGGDDHAADRPFGGDHGARPGRSAHGPGRGPPSAALSEPEQAQGEDPERPQAAPGPARQATGAGVDGPAPAQKPPRPAGVRAAGACSGVQRDRLGAHEDPIDAAVDAPRPSREELWNRRPAPPPRCYYSASPSPLLPSRLSGAREGLFLVPTTVPAGRLLFRSSPHRSTPLP